jgi:hypothetical protein
MGNNDPNEESPYFFKGQGVIDGVVADLMSKGMGEDASQEYELIFAGCSAGGRGVMANCDRVGAALPSNIKYRCIMDSAYWIDIPPITDRVTLQEQTELVRVQANTSANIPDDCRAAHAGEEWKCMLGQYRFPFIRTPYFLHHGQYDSFGVGNYLGKAVSDQIELEWTFPFIPKKEDYSKIEDWRDFFLAHIKDIPTSSQPHSALFSPACTTHCASVSNNFWNLKIRHKTSMSQAVEEWLDHDFDQDGATSLRWITRPNAEPITIECFGIPEAAFVIICILLGTTFILLVYEGIGWCHARHVQASKSQSQSNSSTEDPVPEEVLLSEMGMTRSDDTGDEFGVL